MGRTGEGDGEGSPGELRALVHRSCTPSLCGAGMRSVSLSMMTSARPGLEPALESESNPRALPLNPPCCCCWGKYDAGAPVPTAPYPPRPSLGVAVLLGPPRGENHAECSSLRLRSSATHIVLLAASDETSTHG